VWCLADWNGRLVTGSIDNTLRVWDNEFNCEKTLTDHTGAIYAITIMNGKLVSASSDQVRMHFKLS
jgi:WD40 repeat protein